MDKRPIEGYNGPKGVIAMPKIDAQLGIRVTRDLKERLTAQAKSERKSVSTRLLSQ